MPRILSKRQSSPANRRRIQTFDPSDGGTKDLEYLRPLTTGELRSVMSSTGWSYKGSHEHNPELSPIKALGRFPFRRTGAYEAAGRKDSVVASELERHSKYLASLDWRIVAPPNATPEEEEITQYVRDVLWSMGPAGFAGLVEIIAKRNQFGFSLSETVWEVEETTARWRLESLAYIYPSTVSAWLTDHAGDLVGVLQQGQHAPVAIPVSKLALFVRGFTGRNYYGQSAIRPAWFALSAKSDSLLSRSITESLWGPGWLDVTTESPRSSADRESLVQELQQWSEAEQRFLVHGPGTTVEPRHGGAVLPGLEAVSVYNQEISRALDGGLQDLTTSKFGSRAVGSELRASTHTSMLGEAREICYLIGSQLIAPLLSLNGWDITRRPTVVVKGIGGGSREDTDRARVMLEMVRDGVIPADRADEVTARALELLDI